MFNYNCGYGCQINGREITSRKGQKRTGSIAIHLVTSLFNLLPVELEAAKNAKGREEGVKQGRGHENFPEYWKLLEILSADLRNRTGVMRFPIIVMVELIDVLLS